jgi:hypothetical protein
MRPLMRCPCVLILRFFLIWSLVALHVVGGALLFRRLLPRESAWFGFLVPSLAVIIVLNFIEHGMALPMLRWALPFTFLGSAWLIISPRTSWRLMRVPTATFLTCFAFTLGVRALKPDIDPVRDGRLDVHLIADYLMGGTLPPVSTWLPPFRQYFYYSFEHYGASVMIRLFGFDLGTGFNVASALLSAFILFTIGAIACRLGGHRRWIVGVSVLLTASAMTGSTAYLWLLMPATKDPNDTTNLLNRADPGNVDYPFHHFLHPTGIYDSHELLPPGYWGWIGSFHSTVAGQFLTLLAVYCAVEMTRSQRSNIPWIGIVTCCVLLLLCSTWGLPFVALLTLLTAFHSIMRGIGPRDLRIVIMGLAGVTLCLTPLLLYYLKSEAPLPVPTQSQERTQLFEFLVQWWPVYLPAIVLIFSWRKLNAVVVIVVASSAGWLLVMEHWTIADRLDMTGKIWGYLFGASWAVLIPSLASRRTIAARSLLGLLVVAAGISICFWTDYTQRTLPGDDKWHLDGLGDFRTDAVKGRILQALSILDHHVILSGKCQWAYNEAPLLASLTRNYDYVADDFDCDNHFNPDCFGEGKRRADGANLLYEGKCPDTLRFLSDRKIDALVIWPEDGISDGILASFKTALSGEYVYQDCRENFTDQPNGGVFLRRTAEKGASSIATRN